MEVDIKRTIKSNTSEDAIFQYLLKDRGIKNIENFLNPRHPDEISLGHFFENKVSHRKSWRKILNLLNKIKENKKIIIVYTDYDADGITGGAIVWETLHTLGFNVMPYVPDRKKEGYGFSEKGINHIKEKYDPALIISVDHGIVAHKKITYAKKLGIPVIITDHHQKKETEPEDAFAVFHTSKLSGSGVAYFFAKELVNSFGDRHSQISPPASGLKSQFSNDHLALASIGTIADLVPLTDESRSIAKYGLEAFSKLKKPGLKEVLKEARIDNRSITTYDIGFIIAPRINAFGRLKHGIEALRLLCTNSIDQARELAKQAGNTNRTRQDIVEHSVVEAEQKVDPASKIIVLFSKLWEEGIIGLIASKLMNMYHRPVIIMTSSDGFAKGSARSIPGIDITKFLRDLQEILIDVGGHTAAAGFTIERKKVDEFIKKVIMKADKEIKKNQLVKHIIIDMEIPLQKVSLSLAKKIEMLEPFGIGNSTPVFLSQAILQDIMLVGKDQKHLKLLLRKDDIFLELIYFNGAEKSINLKHGDTIDVIYNLHVDEWNGKEKVKGVVREILHKL